MSEIKHSPKEVQAYLTSHHDEIARFLASDHEPYAVECPERCGGGCTRCDGKGYLETERGRLFREQVLREER